MDIAKTAAPALRENETLIILGQIGDQLTGGVVIHHGARRHSDDRVLAVATMHVRAATSAAVLGQKFLVVLKVDQTVEIALDHQSNVASTSAISAVRPTQGSKFFTPE